MIEDPWPLVVGSLMLALAGTLLGSIVWTPQ